MLAAGIHGYKVWFVVSQVRSAVGVLDCETEAARELGKRFHISCVLEKLGKLPLKVIVCGNEVEDCLSRLEGWSGERKGLGLREWASRMHQRRSQLFHDECS